MYSQNFSTDLKVKGFITEMQQLPVISIRMWLFTEKAAWRLCISYWSASASLSGLEQLK